MCMPSDAPWYLCFIAGECMWIHLPLIRTMLDFCKTLFPVCSYGYTTIPTYPSGQIGFILCSKNKASTLSSCSWFNLHQHFLAQVHQVIVVYSVAMCYVVVVYSVAMLLWFIVWLCAMLLWFIVWLCAMLWFIVWLCAMLLWFIVWLCAMLWFIVCIAMCVFLWTCHYGVGCFFCRKPSLMNLSGSSVMRN